jgi:hypothetical protein
MTVYGFFCALCEETCCKILNIHSEFCTIFRVCYITYSRLVLDKQVQVMICYSEEEKKYKAAFVQIREEDLSQ